MTGGTQSASDRPSLEGLVETGALPLESLHPGGLALSRELASLCGIGAGSCVVDVACGTGETACFLVESLGARVIGVDHSSAMLERARAKAHERGLDVTFAEADAIRLPLRDQCCDAAICECTLCFLDKATALQEMVRVVRPGGRVGMHDLCWRPDAPDALKHVLADIEGERPESLEGWQRLFREAGLEDVHAVDESAQKQRWMSHSRRELGLRGQLVLAREVLRRWGLAGVWTILRAERAFSSRFLGYGLVAGTRPQER